MKSREEVEGILNRHERDKKIIDFIFKAFTGGYHCALDKIERGGIKLKEHGNILKYEDVAAQLRGLGILKWDKTWLELEEDKQND
jgi:hypothetical protein